MLFRPNCRCMVIPIVSEEADVASEPYVSITTLRCTEPGCTRTYTYLGGTPRVTHSVDDLKRDRIVALLAAVEWGWTQRAVRPGDGFRDRRERCPQHPELEPDTGG